MSDEARILEEIEDLERQAVAIATHIETLRFLLARVMRERRHRALEERRAAG
ncbi:MAG: hypothetical protein HYV09_21265 [Deltaproteobacteria bacterium]|nr:hypothetical protein [Deltaproteobacteria bacterium]